MANEAIPFYEPADNLTGKTSGAVTGKRFLKISGNRLDGLVRVAHADAGGRAFGVADADAASGAKVGILRGNKVVPVTADGAIAAFAEVEVGANGKAKTRGSGIPVGVCLTAASDGDDAQIALYDGQGAEGSFATGANIPDAVAITGGESPTEAEFNALVAKVNAIITALETAGILASS